MGHDVAASTRLGGAFMARVLVLEILRWFLLSRTLVISVITVPLDVRGRRCEVFDDVGTSTLRD